MYQEHKAVLENGRLTITSTLASGHESQTPHFLKTVKALELQSAAISVNDAGATARVSVEFAPAGEHVIEVARKAPATWQERVMEELGDIVGAKDRLNRFVASPDFEKLSKKQRELLEEQATVMAHYCQVLEDRLLEASEAAPPEPPPLDTPKKGRRK